MDIKSYLSNFKNNTPKLLYIMSNKLIDDRIFIKNNNNIFNPKSGVIIDDIITSN